MSVGSTVRDENNTVYDVTKLLGTGAMGSVYQAEKRNDPFNIAVKIPHARLPKDLNEQFWQELEVLTKLSGASQGRFFPKVWTGQLTDSGRAVLCMDLVSGRRLVDLAAENRGHLNEKIALEAAIQYAAMIGILHSESISCPDRKPNDVYWNQRRKRLTVLDWNVVDKSEAFEKKRNQDSYIFGVLWYELLTGSLPSPVDERLRRPLDSHPYWPEISFGTQVILRKVLAPDRQQRYQIAAELQRDLTIHLQDFDANETVLVEKASKMLRQAQQALHESLAALRIAEGARHYEEEESEKWLVSSVDKISELKASLNTAMRLADLANRRQVASAEGVWRQAQELRKELQNLITQGSQRVRVVQYTAANQWLTVAEKAVADDPISLLQLQRWRILAEAGNAAIAENLSLKQHLEGLTSLVEALEGRRVNQALDEWKRLQAPLEISGWRSDVEAGRLLLSLGHEVEFWQAWDEMKNMEDSRDFASAEAKARQALNAIELMANTYAGRILAAIGHTLVSLRKKANDFETKKELEGAVVRLLNEGNSYLESGNYDLAYAAFRQGMALLMSDPILSSQGEDRVKLEQGLFLAGRLPRLDRAVEGQSWDGVFTILAELATNKIEHEYVRVKVRAAVDAAIQEIREEKRAIGGNWNTASRTSESAKKLLLSLTNFDAKHHPWLSRAMNWRI